MNLYELFSPIDDSEEVVVKHFENAIQFRITLSILTIFFFVWIVLSFFVYFGILVEPVKMAVLQMYLAGFLISIYLMCLIPIVLIARAIANNYNEKVLKPRETKDKEMMKVYMRDNLRKQKLINNSLICTTLMKRIKK